MNTVATNGACRLAAAAALCGIAAGVAELVVGTSRWLGDKDDPTTLGWATIGIALTILAAAALAARRDTGGARLAAGLVMIVAAAVGLTTVGLAWIPAAIAASAAGVLTVLAARRQRPLRDLIIELWPAALLLVLATIYLAFGIVAGGGYAVLGVTGAAAICVVLALRRRSRLGAAIMLIVGTVPFASAALWTVVLPATAVLILALGLPYLHATDRRDHPATMPGVGPT